MMNVGIAQMMVGLVESGCILPLEAAEADHGSKANDRKARLHRYLEPVRVALETFKQGRLLQREVVRLEALSPHLLDDIGLGHTPETAPGKWQPAPGSAAVSVDVPVTTVAPVVPAPIIILKPDGLDRPVDGIFGTSEYPRNGVGRVHLAMTSASTRLHSHA